MLTRLKKLIALLLLFCSGLGNIAYSQQVEINKDAVNQLQSNLAGTPLGQNVEELAEKVKSAIEVLKQLQSSLESGPIGSAIKIMTDSAHINVYPMFHIAADSALWPYALELYFDVRAERKEPYILVTLNFTPESGEWTDFDSYKLSVSLTQGKTKAIAQEVILPVERELNKILANIGNLKKYFGDIRDNVADAIRKLRMAMMDKYWEGKNLPQVNFYAASNALYGFDPPVQQAIIRKYKDFYRYDTVTLAPWKSLSTEKADKVNAFITIRDTAFKKNQIRFIDRNNVQVQPIEAKNDTLVFSLTGLSDSDEGELTAEYFLNDTIAKKERKAPLAQVKTITYGKCPQTLHIVPVNSATCPGNSDAIKQYLNNAYKQAVVTWDVLPEKKLDVKDWDLDGDGKLNIETSILQRYSDEENAFITAWETDHKNSDDNAAYLFIVDMPNSLNARGYMPLNSHYGFIFTGGDNASVHDEVYYNTIAHELGHGMFKMYHAWDEYGTPERQTNNLMDYQQGAVLWKPQWDWMHDPGIRTYMFQSEEEGASQVNKDQLEKLKNFKNASNNSYTFLTPAGKIISLPASNLTFVRLYDDCIHEDHTSEQAFLIPVGTLAEFKLGDIKYSAFANKNQFKGYKNINNIGKDDYYKDETSKNVIETERKVIFTYPCIDGTCSLFSINKPSLKLKANYIKLSNYSEWPKDDVVYGKEQKMAESIPLFEDTKINVPFDNAKSVILSEFETSLNEEAVKFLVTNTNCKWSSYNNQILRIVNFINHDKAGAYESFASCNFKWLYNPEQEDCFLSVYNIEKRCTTCYNSITSLEEYKQIVNSYYNDLINYNNVTIPEISKTIENWDRSAGALESYLAEKFCSDVGFKTLTTNARLKILSLLGGQTNITGCWIKDERKCAEGQIINTLKYAKEFEYEDIIKLLKGKDNKYELFFNMYNKIHNHGPGGYNFDAFVSALTKIALYVDQTTNSKDIVERNNVFVYRNDLPRLSVGYQSRYFTYELLENKQKVSIYTWVSNSMPIAPKVTLDDLPKTEFDPFETVVIVAQDAYTYPQGSIQYAKGEIWMVPAFVYPAIALSNDHKLLATNIKVGTSFVLIGCSLGMGLVAETPVLAFLDFTDAVALTYQTIATEGSLLSDLESSGSEWAPIAKAANTFCNYYFAFRGVSAVSGLLKASAKELAGISESQLAKLAKSNPSAYEKIANLVAESKKYLNKTGLQEIVVIAKQIDKSIDLLKIRLGLKPINQINLTSFAANSTDDYFDIIIHYKSGKFVIAKEGAFLTETEMTLNNLVKVFEDAQKGNKTIRLLSCNDLNAAIELSQKTNIPFYASDGWVDLYKDGTVTSEKPFYKFQSGKQLEDKFQFSSSSKLDKVTLGEKLAAGADELTDISTTIAKSGEDFTVLANARNLPGTVTGNGKIITGKWLRGTEGNAGFFPKSVADKLRGQTFNSFDEFRQAFWKTVAEDPNLSSQFKSSNVALMKKGNAPIAVEEQWLVGAKGEQKTYILHHKTPINKGGGVYDIDNLYIVTPKYHKEILDPAYHYGYGY